MADRYDSFVRDRLPPPAMWPRFRFDGPALDYPERLNAAVELVDRAVIEGDGGRTALVNEAGSWTYAALAGHSDRIARILVEDEGLVPGGRVLLLGPNTMMLFTAWLGVLKAGGIAVAAMPLLRKDEIATILRKAEVRHAIVDARVGEAFQAAAAATGLATAALTYLGDSGQGELEARMARTGPGFAAHDSGREDPALIAFTSGTTGQPKGCVHCHRDILAPADTFAAQVLRTGRDDVFAGSAPLAFTFGLGALLVFPFRVRATAVTIERPSPAALLEAVARFGVTRLFTAPTAYKDMLGRLADHDLATLRQCVSAGEHLPPAVWDRWREATGLGIVDGIGATELMHIFISAAGDDIRPGATGRVVPGYRACILDDQGRPQATGTGRLAVQGPGGCRYLDDPRQAAYVIDGWNVTGDIFRLDADGYFWFQARADDMIVSAGYNIGAPEVEDALLQHPAVRECAVIGVPCEARGQRVKAFVVAADPAFDPADLTRALQEHVKATIAPYKYPREIEFVDALPRTATGKIQRHALRRPAITS